MESGEKHMLSDVTVLEIGSRVSTGYCGRLLREMGARVVRLDPPGGDPLWSTEPNYAAYLHSGKFVERLRPGADARAALVRLAANADLIVCDDDSPEVLAEIQALRAQRRELVVVAISDYGLSGPASGTPATDFTLQAEGGISLLHPTADLPPVATGVELAEITSGVAAAMGAVTALLYAEAVAGPLDLAAADMTVDVDVSRFESVITLLQYPWLLAQIPDSNPYLLPQSAVPGVERAKDGWVCAVAVTEQQWAAFRRMAGVRELDDERYATLHGRIKNAADVTALVRSSTMRHTVDELVEVGASCHVPIVPVGTPSVLPTLAPYATRGVYSAYTVPAPNGGAIAPASPFRYDRDEPSVGGSGPADRTAREQRRMPTTDPGKPLAGLRVLEVGTFQAGPLVGMNLAALGADVIKIEAVNRPDMLRFTGNPTVERRWEQAPSFAGANLGKRALTADMSQPEGLAIIRALIERSDIVLENFLPRVLDSRGLDYTAVRELRPDAIMVRMPAWGLTSPWRDRPGFTYSVNAVSGLAHLTGYPDGEPLITGTIVDPLAALYATAITLAAVRRRRLTGEGGMIEVALCDVATQLTARAAIAASVTGVEPTRHANQSDKAAPQGIYQCADHSWIAISVASDEQWGALARFADDDGWAAGEGFAAIDGRLARRAELDERMAKLCARWNSDVLEARLREADIAAAVLGSGTDFTDHPQLLARNRVFEVTHPVFGPARYIGSPARYAAAPAASISPAAPLFGEHNDEILHELGYSPADIDQLIEKKIIGSSPFNMAFDR
jgi:crotonobetainyl-CoA:carnitine CoA-transferase CaiB-like acyl-CoA transferase